MTDLEGVPIDVDDVTTRPLIGTSKILVVDDVPANLVAAEAALAPLSRSIVTARSGAEALARLLEENFALALLDIQMPVIDGYELAQLIRSREVTQHLPIIFMTAHSHDEANVLRAYQLGAVDFLFRPLIPEVLRAKVQVFVTLRERNDQLVMERIEREFENRRRDYETTALRRERDREQEANKELNRLNDALAEADRRKDGFIAILAHELRNPLASMRTCVDLLRARPSEPPTPRTLGALERQTELLVRLVDDLLDISRIKADKMELRPEAVDLRTITEGAITTSRQLVDERKHELVVDVPGEPVMVVADGMRIAQVVGNLLHNAARYTNAGGRIEVTVGRDRDLGFVRVRDTGIGIEPELQHTIFSMFVQERVQSDGSGGLGLGLALARRLVEMHNGTIDVHSDGRDRGSVFEIRIPRVGSRLAVAARKRTSDMAPLVRPKPVARNARTIVIDDNEDARELISELLRSRGHEVLTAGDGASGLALIRKHVPDVALVDLGLPVLDGLAVVEALRRDCPGLPTRLVALTGYGDRNDQERTRQAGFHAHLVKPASAAAIFACLDEQLAAPTPLLEDEVTEVTHTGTM